MQITKNKPKQNKTEDKISSMTKTEHNYEIIKESDALDKQQVGKNKSRSEDNDDETLIKHECDEDIKQETNYTEEDDNDDVNKPKSSTYGALQPKPWAALKNLIYHFVPYDPLNKLSVHHYSLG